MLVKIESFVHWFHCSICYYYEVLVIECISIFFIIIYFALFIIFHFYNYDYKFLNNLLSSQYSFMYCLEHILDIIYI